MNNLLSPHSDGVNLNLDELLHYKSQAVRWLPPANSLWSQLSGQHQSRQKGRGMDFSEVRQYQPGDDIRSIDWRVTARTGKPHTKLFSEEREQPVILYIDLNSSLLFGSQLMLKSVQLAHLASLICWLTVAQKDRIGAIIDTGEQRFEFRPSSRNSSPLRIMQQLVKLHKQQLVKLHKQQRIDKTSNAPHQTPTSMSSGLKTLHQLCPKGSDIILLSDFMRYQESDRPLLTQLRKHNRLRLVHIFDPLEKGQTHFRGSEKVSDGDKALWLDFSSKNTRHNIELAFQMEQARLNDLCRSLAIHYTSISSAKSLVEQITGTPS